MTPFLSCDKIEYVGNSSAIPKNKKEKREIFKMAVKIRLTRMGSKK
ncbi:MAG TPA: 30S ribosomal protein S16, partial [Streptococcus sp.]|nr:30S ribosomal protein S16 [Streptococcus sp.]